MTTPSAGTWSCTPGTTPFGRSVASPRPCVESLDLRPARPRRVTGSGVRRIARSRSHLGLGATTTPAVQEGTLTDGLYGLANRWAGILHGCLRHRERYSEEQA